MEVWLRQATSFIRFHHHVTLCHYSLQVSGLGSPLCHDSHGVPIDLSAPVPLQHQVQQTAGGEDTRWPSSLPGLATGLSKDKSPHPNAVFFLKTNRICCAVLFVGGGVLSRQLLYYSSKCNIFLCVCVFDCFCFQFISFTRG